MRSTGCFPWTAFALCGGAVRGGQAGDLVGKALRNRLLGAQEGVLSRPRMQGLIWMLAIDGSYLVGVLAPSPG